MKHSEKQTDHRATIRIGRIGRVETVKKPGDIVLTSRGFEVVK